MYDPARPHQPMEVGDIELEYDDSGNLLEIHNSDTGETKELTWDDDGRLKQTTTNQGKVTNYYDASGLRVLKSSDLSGYTVFANQYFDFRLGGDLEDIGSKHIFAGGMRVLSLVDRYDPSSDGSVPPTSQGVPYYFHSDHLGSANLITGDDGSVYEYLEYFPDGELWIEQKPQTVIANGYRFSGKFLDEETGFYDFGQRFYDPEIGLWLSTDPLFTDTPVEVVGSPVLLSLYTYAAHSPIRLVDPDGRRPIEGAIQTSSDRMGGKGDIHEGVWVSYQAHPVDWSPVEETELGNLYAAALAATNSMSLVAAEIP